jgi:hypothetical protein
MANSDVLFSSCGESGDFGVIYGIQMEPSAVRLGIKRRLYESRLGTGCGEQRSKHANENSTEMIGQRMKENLNRKTCQAKRYSEENQTVG